MNFEKLENNRGKFTFEITPQEFEHALDHAFAHVAQDLELKGFRKGKVPRNVYETKFGVESLYEEAINHALNHKYYEVRQNPQYGFIGEPQVDVDFAKVSREEAFNVSLIFELKPEVTLGAYKNIEVKKQVLEVTDDEVQNTMVQKLNDKSELVVVDKAIENGMTVIFDFEGFVDGEAFEGGKAENYSLQIGSGQFIPGFEEQMLGLKANDQKDLNVKFPAEYQAENLAGKDAVFKVTIHEVKETQLPDLTDEFVAALEDEASNTVEEFRAATRAKLEAEKAEQAKAAEAKKLSPKLLVQQL
ncbi:trigger factor [Mycoplasmatota bacterium]|nr:trigger factor [Mycoplasmatota bacterium]